MNAVYQIERMLLVDCPSPDMVSVRIQKKHLLKPLLALIATCTLLMRSQARPDQQSVRVAQSRKVTRSHAKAVGLRALERLASPVFIIVHRRTSAMNKHSPPSYARALGGGGGGGDACSTEEKLMIPVSYALDAIRMVIHGADELISRSIRGVLADHCVEGMLGGRYTC